MTYLREIGKKGFLTYKYNGKYIYSYYDPDAEAKRYLNSIEIKSEVVITCCGLDYINTNLLKLGVKEILSFDPLKFDYLDKPNKIKRFITIEEIENYILSNKILNPQIIVWQPLIETNSSLYLSNLKKLKDFLTKNILSTITKNTFGFLESRNIIRNVINLPEIFYLERNANTNNKIAAVISSGYSLKDNVDFLKKIRDIAYIFALPSSLPYLLHNNIHPDYCIAVDPGYATFYHLSKYSFDINLIAPISLNPTIFNLKNIKPLFFNYGGIIENYLYNKCNIVESPSEGSVIFNLLKILPQIGFNNTILIGSDFCYKDNRSHIDGGNFEKELIATSNYFSNLEDMVKKLESKKDTLYINDNDRKLKSDISLMVYFNHFINQEFGLSIFLPPNPENHLNNKYRVIDSNFVFSNFEGDDKKNTLKIQKLNNHNEIKYILQNKIKNHNEKLDKEFLSKIDIDTEKTIHKNFLKKITGAIF